MKLFVRLLKEILRENKVQHELNHIKSTTLVFPATNQSAWDYIEAALERGESVCCAASSKKNVNAEFGMEVQSLPSIYEQEFKVQLHNLIVRNGISRIFCPVLMVYDHIRRLIEQGEIQLELIGGSPIKIQVQRHQRLMGKAESLFSFFRSCDQQAESVHLLDFASMLRSSGLIYGESNDEKLTAMFSVLSSAPKGDVIEIGCLMGKSAFVLSYASQLFELGSLLTVDPWDFGETVQKNSPTSLKEMAQDWNFEVLREGFFVNTLQSCHSNHVHLRMPSELAFGKYTQTGDFYDLRDKSVPYLKQISAIHIDGNHDYESVKLDCELWLTKVQAGTWLILDDYIWAHGDGPFRVGNALLQNEWHRIRRSFVCGKALFVQFDR